MARFIERQGFILNVDSIKSVSADGKGVCVVYNDNEQEYFSLDYEVFRDFAEGRYAIRQIIPVKNRTFAIYEYEGKRFRSEILYLAVTESGEIRPVQNSGGYYSFADDVENFLYLEEDGIIGWEETKEKAE